MSYTLKATNSQYWLIERHIFELFNWRFQSDISEYDFTKFDYPDIHRATIKHKFVKSGKTIFKFQNLTEGELRFIVDEIKWHVLENRYEDDKSETRVAKNLVKKIEDLLDKSLQRNLKLELLGI
jgi:hypothetical protein